jgi:hypothetical protein
LNKNVLKWAPLGAIAALAMIFSPSHAQSSRPKGQKPAPVVSTQKAKKAPAAPSRTAPVRATYASAEPGCVSGRKMLWTDGGWIVRRVTSCR